MKNLSISPDSVHEVIAKHMLADVFSFVLDLERSEGNHIFDSKGKRKFLDCFSFIASNPLGYNHPKMFDAEFEKKLLRAARIRPSNSDVYTAEMAEFVSTFASIAMPSNFEHLFFIDGGALAIENALKAAFDWKVRLNQTRGEKGEKGYQVIHFLEAFHGRSGYTLSLTNTDPKKTKYFPKFDWPRISNPKLKFPLNEKNLNDVKSREEESIAQLKQVLEQQQSDIACIIIEPIQGEGGDNHFRPEFHQALRRLADSYDVMLVYDEVQSGMGLTGKMWAHQHYGVQPDMVAFGKKTQVCGFMSTTRIDSVENNVFQEKSRINSTWGGNLVDMVRCARYLEIIEEDKLLDNVVARGQELMSGLEALTAKFPEVLSAPRGKGLMCAIDIASQDKRSEILKKTFDLGLILLPCGELSIRFRPSLTFTSENVKEAMTLFEDALK
jgi:L-lysine 6-transaminase